MNVRLVAYRKATSSDTIDTTYELDLQEAPNVSLNYRFSDIKEPETRKASYSQTFKLPFTDNNNKFFQNWFNVNLETLVFNTGQKFEAALYVGTVPQFEGIIQLKSIYKKAQLYEVVLMSTVADLFSAVGNKRLKDVFRSQNADGEDIYSEELNHTFSKANVVYSWDGSSTSFQNTAGTSLRDATAGVQKVIYPMSLTEPKFYYNPNTVDVDGNTINTFLSMSQSDINAIGYSVATSYWVPITQLRPAIQIKELLKLIIAKAGFSYTSSFIDGSYFGKLFMTTCGFITQRWNVPTTTDIGADGYMNVGNSTEWGDYSVDASTSVNCNDPVPELVIPADTITPTTNSTTPQDTTNAWNEANNYFTKTSPGQGAIRVVCRIKMVNVSACYETIPVAFRAKYYDVANNQQTNDYVPFAAATYTIENTTDTTSGQFAPYVNLLIDISNVAVGESIYLTVQPMWFEKANASNAMTFTIGGWSDYINNNCFGEIRCSWDWWGSMYLGTIDIPSCIDEKITQKDFLKDIVERFNLIVLTDPDNPTNMLIEPYDDFIASGDIKYWSDKLDLSKEIIVRDTVSLQKKTVLLSDKEDNDLMNKAIKEEQPAVNPYGKLEILEAENQFATGEMKNNSIFSPYVNQKVFVNEDDTLPTALPNMAVQYEWTSKAVEGGYENILEETKPKLFYYSGSPTPVKDGQNNDITYYMHWLDSSGTPTVMNAESFTTYPLCSPFELNASSGGSTITPTTKSLYWDQAPPIVPQLSVFNLAIDQVNIYNSLFYTYWHKYFNQIYSSEARIMECYLNLNETDVFSFSFADEIFIKDTYWRILEISNYQVGAKASTKVKLITVGDTYNHTGEYVDYVLGSILNSNTFGPYFLWCPATSPGCTPSLVGPNFLGMYADVASCYANGGTPFLGATLNADDGLYPCVANTGSLPIKLQTIEAFRSIFSNTQTKTIISGKIEGLNNPLTVGSYTNKYSQSLMRTISDSVVIKYANSVRNQPLIDGENHRMVLIGNTSGNTKGYAYSQGNSRGTQLSIPNNSNMIIRIKGITTVIGGTSSSYPVGTTEGFAYYTGFKNVNGAITQIGVAGGQNEFGLREGSNPATCTMYIDSHNGVLRFGLQDSQTDTNRVWQITVDLDVNRVYNMNLGYDENWALYQNGRFIELQNNDYLIWN